MEGIKVPSKSSWEKIVVHAERLFSRDGFLRKMIFNQRQLMAQRLGGLARELRSIKALVAYSYVQGIYQGIYYVWVRDV